MSYQTAPNTAGDIVLLIARIYITLPDDADLKRLHTYSNTDFKWRKTCVKCNINPCVLKRILRQVKEDYEWLKHRDKKGRLRVFKLREIITLFVSLTNSFERRDWELIMAYHDLDGVIEDICAKHNITRDGFYRFLRDKIKKPYMKLFSHPTQSID